MSEERDVASAFAWALMIAFVHRRLQWVTIDAAIDQALGAMCELHHSGDVRFPSAGALARRLAETHAECFTWDGRRLSLTARATVDRALVSAALSGFLATTSAADAARPTTAANLTAEEGKALDDFFDGYEKEIMRARLGQDTDPKHG